MRTVFQCAYDIHNLSFFMLSCLHIKLHINKIAIMHQCKLAAIGVYIAS